MKRLIIKYLGGSPTKTAKILFVFGILLAIIIAFSKDVWNIYSVSVSLCMGIIFISAIYVSIFPPSIEKFNEITK